MAEPVDPGEHPWWAAPWISWVFLSLVVVAFAVAVGDQWSATVSVVRTLRPSVLLISMTLALIGLVGPWRAWSAVLTDLGSPVAWRHSAPMFFVAQLGKYLPGAVWPVVLQLRHAPRLGIRPGRVALAFMLTLALGVSSGLAVAATAVVVIPDSPVGLEALVVPVVLLLALLRPRLVNRMLHVLLRMLRRPDQDLQLTTKGLGRATVAATWFWVIGGLHVFVLAVSLGAPARETLPIAIAVLSLGVSLGPLAVVLPAGAGLREVIMIVGLNHVLSAPESIAVALTSRLILVLGDCVLAALSAVVELGDRRSRTDRQTTPVLAVGRTSRNRPKG